MTTRNLRIRRLLSFSSSQGASLEGSWTRTALTEEDLAQLAKKMRTSYCWDADPKPFQFAGVQAQLEGQDIIIQAATGSGKTAIAAGPHLWKEGMQSIMVCPLMTLEDEMVRC